jgi:hypothetical protein
MECSKWKLICLLHISHTLINITDVVVVFIVIIVVVVIVVVAVVTVLLLVLHLLLLTVLLRSPYDPCKIMKVVLKPMTCRKSCSFLSKDVVYNL